MVDPDRLRSLFEQADELNPADQLLFLARACGGDDELLNAVSELLQHVHPDVDDLGEEALDPLIGETIGRWILHSELGTGASGCVYEGRSGPDSVAIKVLHGHRMSHNSRRRFEQEARILRGLQHDHICKVLDAGVAELLGESRPWMAMPRIPGARSLWSYVLEHEPSRSDRLTLFCKICRAVGEAHRRGVVHRDLKPDNILIDRDGVPYVIDFGIARATDDDLRHRSLATQQGQLLGTMQYIAPELAGSGNTASPESDVYALGLMLFELLAGEPPYIVHPTNVAAAIDTIRRADPPPLSSLDRTLAGDLNTIVETAIARDPNRRYATATSLANDIERAINGDPVLAKPEPRLGRYLRRHRHAATVLMVATPVFAVIAIIAGVLAYDAIRSRDQVLLEATRRERLLEYTGSLMTIREEVLRPHETYWASQIDQLARTAKRMAGEDSLLLAQMLTLAAGPDHEGIDRQKLLERAAEAIAGLDDAVEDRVAIRLKWLRARPREGARIDPLLEMVPMVETASAELRADLLSALATCELDAIGDADRTSRGHNWSQQAEELIVAELGGDPGLLIPLYQQRAWAWVFRPPGDQASLAACHALLMNRLIPMVQAWDGPGSLADVQARGMLGLVLLRQGGPAKATGVLRTVVNDAKAVAGMTNNITWRYVNNLALALCAASEATESPDERTALRAEAATAWRDVQRATQAYGVRGEVDYYTRVWAENLPEQPPDLAAALAVWDAFHADR